jgi:hypothetical protein
MSFAAPWALLLLIPLAVGVAWWMWRERRGTERAAVPFADLDLVALAAPPPRWTRWLPGLLLVLALTGFTFALARPEAVMSSRSVVRWSARRWGERLGIALTSHDPAAVFAGIQRFAWCLVTGLALERPEGEQ